MRTQAKSQVKTDWYEDAVVYQIYPLSFMDSNNDGIGDIEGIISKLDYIKDLGVTAIWFSPLYDSPWKDYGYDIADYRKIHPAFGTMEDFDRLLEECHKRGLKVLMDMVVNHTSDQHEWFQEALADPSSPYRDYYIIREGKAGSQKGKFKSLNLAAKLGKGSQAGRKLEPPTNWTSSFTGSAWKQIDGTNEFYLHLFCDEQPDLNWENPAVRKEIVDILNFWMDKGVDGFRFDVFNLFSKVYPFQDDNEKGSFQKGMKYFVDGPRMHEFLHQLNVEALALHDSFTVGESYFPDPDEALRYVRKDSEELDSIFDFKLLECDNVGGLKYIPKPFNLREFKAGFFNAQAKTYGVGQNTLVLENHDNARSNSRFGIDTKKYRYEASTFLALVTFMGYGIPFIYQGEEIGMTNARFTSLDEMKDPVSHFIFELAAKYRVPKRLLLKMINTGARDNARVPMQWDDSVNAGFNAGAEPWQCMNENYREINVKNDLAARRSIYRFYQELLEIKKNNEVAVHGETRELELSSGASKCGLASPLQGFAEGASKCDLVSRLQGFADPAAKHVIAYTREYEGRKLLVVGNFSGKRVKCKLPEGFAECKLKVLLKNYDYVELGQEIILRPYEALLMEVE